MALYKLEDGASSVDLSPTRGLNIPETRVRQLIETKEGKPDAYEWGNAEKYEIPLINITKANADQLLDWWENMDVLTFTPDPGSPIQMIVDGIERPINMWHHEFDKKYAGMLRLCEVSSQSFSSSQISVSRSESCSSRSDSESCSVGSDLSCSEFLLGISRSSSVGIDVVVVEDVSCSASVTDPVLEIASCSTYSSSLGDGFVTISSCSKSLSGSDSQSCSDSSSRSSSVGVLTVLFTSQSCSLDPSESSCSNSVGGESCSKSAGGIS